MSLPTPGPDRTAVVSGASSVLLPILVRSHPGLRE
jgi:hypothetical protein